MVSIPQTVPFSWVGHSDSRGQRPDQQDADHKSSQESDRHRRTQTPLDLCKRHTHTQTLWYSTVPLPLSKCYQSRLSSNKRPPMKPLHNTTHCLLCSQQRSTVASMMHRQETVECLKKFNARRKLKVSDNRSDCTRWDKNVHRFSLFLIAFNLINATRIQQQAQEYLIIRLSAVQT